MCNKEKPWLASYDHGVPEMVEIPAGKTSRDYLEESLRALPASPAVFFFGRSITFAQLDELSLRFASFLSRSGCGPGSVVALHMPNLPHYLIAMVGALRAGCTVTGASILLTEKELLFQLKDSGAKVLVTLDMFFEKTAAPAAEKAPELKKVLVANVGDYLPSVKRALGRLLKKIPVGRVFPVPGKEVSAFTRTLAAPTPGRPEGSHANTDGAVIQYT
ncbi:MAG: AMP-binding protein, partial [Thermodesulfobacteriota bacterium]